ncbi:hypothetical protein TD95_004955 [Thielaviopsis punctulata]|uniref:Major facilitator superfamily (MFS) profile domain-containing protein n=1 Tax=Thielaviopsis punctulata TaxID=72032 RepID=A0A0F4ZJT8_9PEZI|nr:hypothetical protein TD95_004955 [Thielaviopsis punctulata]
MSDDEAHQALIGQHGAYNRALLDDSEIDDDDERTLRGVKSAGAPGLFVWLLTAAAGISGLLFGYDTGIISATLVSINNSLSGRALTSLDKSLITSSTALFALLISPFSSILADSFGRRRVILVADGLFIIGALVQAVANTVSIMVLGRCIVGAAVGAASFVVPLYIAEIAPAAHRGRLVTANVLFITFGQVVAYIIGWIFSYCGNPDTAWRWMVGLGAVPAIVQMLLLAGMPETPRWMVRQGNVSGAKQIVFKANACPPQVADAIVREIEIEVMHEQEEAAALRVRRARSPGGPSILSDTCYELLTVPKNRRALVIACLLQGLQQLSGFNSLMYFSATIFTLVGFSMPTLTSLTVALTNMAFTAIALVTIDRIGRRRILLWSIPMMIVGLLLSAYGFSRLNLIGSTATSNNPAVVILVSFMIYVAGYAIGIGNVPWMQSELFPLSVRSLGSGMSTATNWGANFIIGLTFLPMMDALTPTWTFVLYACVCGLGHFLIWRIYPETAGLSLEEVTSLLDEGWGV